MIWSRRHWLVGLAAAGGLATAGLRPRAGCLAAAGPGTIPAPPGGGAPQPWTLMRRGGEHELAAGARAMELVYRRGHSQIELTVVTFDRRLATLRVIDAEAFNVRNAPEAATVADAIAVVNGGYFDPRFEPVGLQMTNGHATGEWVGDSSLLGGAVAVRDGLSLLLWRAEVAEPESFGDLLQAGPRLVHNGQPIEGFRNDQPRPRTFVATDSGDAWAIGIARSSTLADLAELLATPDILPGLAVNRALNLDGGRSSAMWFTSNTGIRRHHPHGVRVRNYLALVPALAESG